MTTQTIDKDRFFTHYLEACLWTEEKEHLWIEDLPADTIKQMKADCKSFLDKAMMLGLLDTYNPNHQYTIEEQAGHDFWLTRNGHGAGFWDREHIWGKENATHLTNLSEQFGEYHLDI